MVGTEHVLAHVKPSDGDVLIRHAQGLSVDKHDSLYIVVFLLVPLSAERRSTYMSLAVVHWHVVTTLETQGYRSQ